MSVSRPLSLPLPPGRPTRPRHREAGRRDRGRIDRTGPSILYGFDYATTVGAALESFAKMQDLAGADAWIEGLEDYLERVEPVEGPPED